MRHLLAVFLLPVLVTSSFADGLPVDEKGNITIPYTTISLNASQQEELEALDSITLTPDQWSKLRKISPNTPKRIMGILPITWNDCTCLSPFSAIKMSDGSIAILHEEQTPNSLAWRILPGKHLTIRIDRRGQCYLDGILVRFPILIEAIQASKPVPNDESVDPWNTMAEVKSPPGMKLDDPVFEDRVLKLYTELAAKNWNQGKVPDWLSATKATQP